METVKKNVIKVYDIKLRMYIILVVTWFTILI